MSYAPLTASTGRRLRHKASNHSLVPGDLYLFTLLEQRLHARETIAQIADCGLCLVTLQRHIVL